MQLEYNFWDRKNNLDHAYKDTHTHTQELYAYDNKVKEGISIHPQLFDFWLLINLDFEVSQIEKAR